MEWKAAYSSGAGRSTMTTSMPSARAAFIFASVAAAAAVLGDERVDPLIAHQGDLVLDAEWSAREDQAVERQRTVRGIDRPHEVTVLRRPREFSQLHAADGQEHVARSVAKRADRSCHIGHDRPAIIVLLPPGRPGQAGDGKPHLPAGGDGISRNLDSERMRRVDNRADFAAPSNRSRAPPRHRSRQHGKV